ncbi:MAG: hypothetical protein AB7I50_17240 [Vicinamibacterales bacterium]
MRIRHFVGTLAVALLSSGLATAAPNVTNVTQKGSLIVFPAISIAGLQSNVDTLVRIQNDGSSDVDVKCYWMDANKNRVDFIFPLTRNQAVWFDARTGNGTYQVNHFPTTVANGFDNPFIPPFTTPGPGPVTTVTTGILACWAVDGGAQNQIKWNHLSGTATLYAPVGAALEYSAYAFYVPTGADLAPIGVAGSLNLNGLEYDACPLYQIGQFTPAGAAPPAGAPFVQSNLLFVSGCTLDLRQDWTPVFTKLQFDVWNEDEVKFTGAYECADSFHFTAFNEGTSTLIGGSLSASLDGIDSAAQNFQAATLGSYAARYRVQGVKSTQCEKPATTGATDTYRPAITTQAVGIVGMQLTGVATRIVGTTLAGAGKFNGKISWDPSSAVPEGGVR